MLRYNPWVALYYIVIPHALLHFLMACPWPEMIFVVMSTCIIIISRVVHTVLECSIDLFTIAHLDNPLETSHEHLPPPHPGNSPLGELLCRQFPPSTILHFSKRGVFCGAIIMNHKPSNENHLIRKWLYGKVFKGWGVFLWENLGVTPLLRASDKFLEWTE